jgi:antitoxin YefM
VKVEAITYSAARENMADTMDRVCDNHEPVIITRRNSRSVVMMSLDDFNSIQETAYLLRNPSNAARLRKSIQQFEEGKVLRKDLLDK